VPAAALVFLVLIFPSEAGGCDGVMKKQVPHRAYRPIRNDIDFCFRPSYFPKESVRMMATSHLERLFKAASEVGSW
jgi:hypothetical protein